MDHQGQGLPLPDPTASLNDAKPPAGHGPHRYYVAVHAIARAVIHATYEQK